MKQIKLTKNLLLCAALCVSLTSCGARSTDKDSDKDNKKNTIESVTEATDNPVNTPDSVTNSIQPLSILAGDYHDQQWSQDYNTLLASVTYPIISLKETCAKDYPKLANALEQLSKERKSAQLTAYEDLVITAQDEALINREYFNGLTTEETVSVRRADSVVTSLLFDGYSYQGGAHGSYYFDSAVFDSQTGKQLELQDVITDMNQLPSLVEEQLFTSYGTEGYYDNLNLEEYFNNNEASVTWTLDYNGITIFFNPYEIAPYAAGNFTVTLSYDMYPDLFNDNYVEVPESYAIEIPSDTTFYFDLDNNETLDTLSLWEKATEYYECDFVCINLNEQTTEDELGAFDMEASLVHTSDDKNYLFVESTSENDYCKITVYDLNAGTVQKVDTIYSGFYNPPQDTDDYYPVKQVLTNPDEFLLDTRTEVLSTVFGYKTYSVGANGMPVTEDELYLLSGELELTLLQPLEVDIINKDTGETTGKKTLDTGTKVVYYRTDNELTADLQLPDGTIGRLILDSQDWPRTINHVSIEEIFENLIFAG